MYNIYVSLRAHVGHEVVCLPVAHCELNPEDRFWKKDGFHEEYTLSLSPDEGDDTCSSNSGDSDDSDTD